jgi:hypothetical protein
MKSTSTGGLRSLLRKAAPAVIAALVFVAVLRRYPIAEIAAQMRVGSWMPLIPLAAAFALSYLLIATLCDLLVLRQFGAIGYWTVFKGKAAASLLTIVGYVVGNGGYGIWIARTLGLSASLSGGIILFFVLSDLSAVGVAATLAFPFTASAIPRAYSAVALVVALAQPLLIVILPRFAEGTLPAVFEPWRLLPPRAALLQLGGRVVNIAIAVVTLAIGSRRFGLAIPLPAMMSYGPAILLAASLPFNLAGVGAGQGAWLLFFARYESGARIVAFHLMWQWLLGAAYILRGLPFLRQTLRAAVGSQREVGLESHQASPIREQQRRSSGRHLAFEHGSGRCLRRGPWRRCQPG